MISIISECKEYILIYMEKFTIQYVFGGVCVQRRKSSCYVQQTSILHIIHLSLPYRSQNILKICSYISCKSAKVHVR